jgi:hypothetical protein
MSPERKHYPTPLDESQGKRMTQGECAEGLFLQHNTPVQKRWLPRHSKQNLQHLVTCTAEPQPTDGLTRQEMVDQLLDGIEPEQLIWTQDLKNRSPDTDERAFLSAPRPNVVTGDATMTAENSAEEWRKTSVCELELDVHVAQVMAFRRSRSVLIVINS